MKAIIRCTVIKEIEVPEGTLTLDAKRIVNRMTPEEIVAGATMDISHHVEVCLPHASTTFDYHEKYPCPICRDPHCDSSSHEYMTS